MKRWYWSVPLLIFASPILAIRSVLRFVRYLSFLRKTIQPTLTCRTCGATIHLLGMWRCGCGHTAEGHVLRFCPVCHSFPAMIRCCRCGATEAVRR
jgi:hypothetical protein